MSVVALRAERELVPAAPVTASCEWLRMGAPEPAGLRAAAAAAPEPGGLPGCLPIGSRCGSAGLGGKGRLRAGPLRSGEKDGDGQRHGETEREEGRVKEGGREDATYQFYHRESY